MAAKKKYKPDFLDRIYMAASGKRYKKKLYKSLDSSSCLPCMKKSKSRKRR